MVDSAGFAVCKGLIVKFSERFYVDATSGLHRENTEEFFAREAAEKLFHLGKGSSILDFGCGSADLTVYYTKRFGRVVAADLSANMLERARKRAAEFDAAHVVFLHADDATVWDRLGGERFDVITTAGVMQHLSPAEVESFTRRALGSLNDGGRIVHFDIPDPRIYLLVRLGFFDPTAWRWRDLPRSLYLLAKLLGRRALDAFRGHPTDIMGYQHHPATIRNIASRCGFHAETVSSMYYEYRYHAMLRPARVADSQR